MSNVNHTIKFTHGEKGKIQIPHGHTVYSNLFMLGAFASTIKETITDDKYQQNFATDDKGLEYLIGKSDETLMFLNEALVSLGLVLTETKSVHVTENRDQLTWLSIGLAELSAMVADNNARMHDSLRGLGRK